ncbi:MAG: His-Xaa-Ser system radical SAM maturase HxsB [Candidatus Portnoybacteria bacterium]|nr:His-Xaa-Ser system radical SAM maturase HxsB [Candidatus Portnoybacteria bacterium]
MSSLNLKKIKYNQLGFFRFKKIKNKYLLTNDVGDYLFLKEKEFENFLTNSLEKDKEPYLSLKEKNFLKNELDLTELIEKYRSKKAFLFGGPSLHIVVVTLRCNHQCIYCHASAQDMSRKDLDMSQETANQVVDKIFQTTSPFLAIEFQGGEPLINWPVVKFIVEEAYRKNKKAKKDLQIRLVSNFDFMTEERFKYLLDKKVSLCVSLDGPEKLHNKNRPIRDSENRYSNYRNIVKWVKKFNKLYPQLKKKGYIYRIAGRVTISRFSLSKPKEIVDEYIKLGFDSFYLHHLNPFGFSLESQREIGYIAKEYINFYKKALDYIIQLNLKGKKFKEKMAVTFLTKILTDYDPNHLDYRSPCGAGIGQLAYHYNGDVYTCDEGRMLSMMGDESFRLGNVRENSYQEIVASPIIRTLCTASCLEGLPGCSDCIYKPYCGVCPIYNYFEQGNIFGQMPTNERCQINQAILNFLFEKLQDPKIKAVLESWPKK